MRPARPWINVLANPNFGAQISEAGAGYTWADNSRMNQLTPWSNDPVADPSGESLLLQDVQDARNAGACAAAATPKPRTRSNTARGKRRFDIVAAISTSARRGASMSTQSIKQVRITVATTMGTRARRLRIVGTVDWAMGAQRSDRQSVLHER